MRDREHLIDELLTARREASPQRAIQDVLSRAVSDVESLVEMVGVPSRAEIQRLHTSSELTVLNVVWGPRMVLKPHNHNMWAAICVYTGREDNIFWRRLESSCPGLEAASAKSIAPGDVRLLGENVIHSVTNPTSGFTGAIHVYGGDLVDRPGRSIWHPVTQEREPYDIYTLSAYVKEMMQG